MVVAIFVGWGDEGTPTAAVGDKNQLVLMPFLSMELSTGVRLF
ncbi:MAG: hypothetical protein ABJI60_12440 [Kangiellaceae bacterium]